MDVERGFEIEYPSVVVPWDVSEEELTAVLPRPPRRVTDGYHTFDCTALCGLVLVLGFHFEPRRRGTLRELEFFRTEPAELSVSFARFQHHLELTFGPPHATTRRPRWYPSHVWTFGDVTVRHFAQHRFVHEDKIRIERI